MTGSITDVGGIRVGHHHRLDPDATLGAGWATGVTVLITPPGTVGAVDCRGGAPGSRETDLLDPTNSVRHVDAVVLAGGSAYGLAAADGVMTWLEEQGRGLALEGGVVPIVPGAVIFDLPVGDWAYRPTAEFGYQAAADAVAAAFPLGTVGAGVGARAGALKGGVGTASTVVDIGGHDVTVGALVVVNATGEVVDRVTGLPWSADLVEEFGLTAPPSEELAVLDRLDAKPTVLNTTIGVVATDAAVSADGCRRLAISAQDGLARALRPAHTPLDGDMIFALATGAVEVSSDQSVPTGLSPETAAVAALGAAGADCMARAVLVGVLAAKAVAGIPTYRGTVPGAFSTRLRAGEP